MQKSSFEGRFLSKLSKIDRQEVETFLNNVVREKRFLDIVFNAMLDGIIVLQAGLQVAYTNNAALDLLGISARRRVIGERLATLLPQGEFNDLVARFALNRERIVNAEVEVDSPARRYLFVTFIPLEDVGEKGIGSVIIILHDITEARRHEEEKRKAEHATTLATLTAGLAHEIKNPLNSLNIHAQLLQRSLRDLIENPRKAEKQRILTSSDIIVEEIRRLSDVLDSLLSAVRPTRPLVQKSSVNRLVERVAATMRPEIESCGVSLILRLDAEIPTTEFDPNQMTQALLNLLKNALEAVCAEDADNATREVLLAEGSLEKALPEEPSPKRIEVRTELKDSEYRISVVDNGKGIPTADLKRVIEPYFTTKFSGTGLGLSIVSRIVDEHRGRLEINSTPEQGTSVTMVFRLDSRPVRLLAGTGGGGEH